MDAPHPVHRCEVCGEPTELCVTEIVTPRRAVVTRYYCKEHWPQDDADVYFKKELDSSIGDLRKTIRELEDKIDELLERKREDRPDGGAQ
jgi:hypothetical protein